MTTSEPAILPDRGLQLDRVVLLGRTFEEYCRFFASSPHELRHRKIVDVASGVSSFGAEGRALGLDITSVDPIYDRTPDQIAPTALADLDHVHRGVANLPTYRWDFYRDPDHMGRFREKALAAFLHEYSTGRGHRYIPASLPELPFHDGQFDLGLVSYFLFAYDRQLSWQFHRDAILEMSRIARETRIYPIVNFEGRKSLWLDQAMIDPALKDLLFEEVRTDFEFLVNSNSYLRVTRRA